MLPGRPLTLAVASCRPRVPWVIAASAGAPPDLYPPHPPLALLPPDQQAPAGAARGAWQRGSRRHRLPPAALSLIAERQRSSSSSGGGSNGDSSSSGGKSQGGDATAGSAHPVLASAAYQAALHASLSRSSLSTEQLMAGAPARAASPGQQLMDEVPDLQALVAAAMAAVAGPALDEMLQRWTAAAPERPPGFDSQAALALPGLAGGLGGALACGSGPVNAGLRSSMQHWPAGHLCPAKRPSYTPPSSLPIPCPCRRRRGVARRPHVWQLEK